MKPADALRSIARRRRRPADGAEPSRPLVPGSPAPAISGVAPDGSPVGADPRGAFLTLVFLTSECRECQAAWQRVRGGSKETVVVTPGPETESSRTLSRLSEAGGGAEPLTVVMSSAAWHAYGVTKAPWMIETEAGAVVTSKPYSL